MYAFSLEVEGAAALGQAVEALSLGRLIRRSMWANRGLYGQILLGTLMVNLLGLAMPLYIMNVYDRVVPTGALESLWVLSAGVILAGLFDVGLRQLRGYLTDIAGRRMDVVLGNQVLDRMLQARIARTQAASGSTAHAVRELDALREFFNSGTLVALGDLPFLGLFLVVLWIVARNIALVPLVALPAVLFASLALQPFIVAFMGRAYKNASNRNAVLFDILGGMEALKALGPKAGLPGAGSARMPPASRPWCPFAACRSSTRT
ncbi:hypothetical protein HPQ64_02870 [Rhizobiales bacterium]|uniref:ABC transporter transmembrane domain-containing protein n=1 Tax=Hongsoonwoonella zoysiae TaxID=2821844 RepID=UPI0015610D05|nr:hypothetical protein [Hongsoonwoonella zoysiae]